ncbi:MAG: DUF4097 family beta strand repeat-containing protein [Sediminicola sp.]
MSTFEKIPFKGIMTVLFCLFVHMANSQKTKTYKETFTIDPDAVLDINTSQADIVFETWDKGQVQIEATITVEGVSDTEAEKYLKSNGMDIMGNSKLVKVRTGSKGSWAGPHDLEALRNLDISLPPMPSIDSLFFSIPNLPALIEMPPMPPVPSPSMKGFDYATYKKEGEKYMEKWQKEFSKGFDKDYERKMEEWGKQMEEKAKEMAAKQQRNMEKLNRQRNLQEQSLHDAQRRNREAMEEARTYTYHMRDSLKGRAHMSDSLSGHFPPTIYWSSPAGEKSIKVKRVIKIKMPKSTKIKMNVRHGEVQLAENTKNMNATLSYARLNGNNIEGVGTNISVSYSPVSVLKWNYGKLKTSYSEQVDLKEVGNLDLHSTSSNISIGHLRNEAKVVNRFGHLTIQKISNDFKDIHIDLENSELQCNLPESAFNCKVNSEFSDVKYPADLHLDTVKGHNGQQDGYHLSKGSDRDLVLVAKYSDVVLK